MQRGLEWLKSQQKDTGDLRGKETMYSHGIATITLAEAYGMTRDPSLVDPVRRAVDFILGARQKTEIRSQRSEVRGQRSEIRDQTAKSEENDLTSDFRPLTSSFAGWRYEPGQAGDTSVFGWQVMALTSAARAGIDVPAEALQASREWLDQVNTDRNSGLYSYQPGERFTPTTLPKPISRKRSEIRDQKSEIGEKQNGDRPALTSDLRPLTSGSVMQSSADFIVRNLPNWKIEPNTYYWYYATLALYQHGGPAWEKWNAAITKQLLDNQNTTGTKAGSWDPIDRWSKIGGRIYQTALCTLCLEVYYRYLPMYGRLPRTYD